MNRIKAGHIGLNAHLLSLSGNYRSAGLNWYIYHILCHLPAAAPELRYTVFLHEPRFSPPAGMSARRSRWSTSVPHRRIAWEQLLAPIALYHEGIDLLHGMAFVTPLAAPCPTVVTVPDLSFLHYPQAFKPLNRLYLATMVRLSARQARQVIAISESARRDVITHLDVPTDRVCTAYCGVHPSFHPLPRAEVDRFRRRKGLPERFVLFLGTIEPRKNVARLIDAFGILVDSASHEISDVHLVVAGGRGWMYEDVLAQLERSNHKGRVHLVGYVSEEEKPWWYNAATVFCYPSLYEGFGLPPLEAMACGVPVIASNASALPEVVGDAGITVPADDTAALSEALRQLLTSPDLRLELGARGRARAERFSWARAASQTAAVYHRALEEA